VINAAAEELGAATSGAYLAAAADGVGTWAVTAP
jgi:hypothetical protein